MERNYHQKKHEITLYVRALQQMNRVTPYEKKLIQQRIQKMNNSITNKVLKASLFTGLFIIAFLIFKNQSTKEFYLDYLSVYVTLFLLALEQHFLYY